MDLAKEKERVTSQDVPIGHIGQIVSGSTKVNWLVKVQDDSEDTGGFFVLLWNTQQSFDDWVRNDVDLKLYFSDKDWVIRWSAEPIAGQPISLYTQP